jgi:23S rRNA (uracil1939-C5)-methyltransferase
MKKETRSTPPAKKTGNKPKTCQTLELVITSINNDGFGVSRHENTQILIAGALPGETVRAKTTYVGRRETFAAIAKVIKPSPDRAAYSGCDKGACDGCPLMHMKYQAQLAWKKQLVAGYIRRYKCLEKAVLNETIPSPLELHYRNSAKLVVAGKFADPVIGIYRRNSHDVMDVAGCAIHHPLIDKVIEAVKTGIKKGKVPIYHPKSQMGLLRYLVIRVSESTDRAMVVFVTAERSYNEIHHLAKHVKNAVPQVSVIAQNVNGSQGNVILGQKDHFVTREQVLPATLGETRFLISPRSFFQVNSGSARIIYEKVREWGALTGSEKVLDLYCGIGGISLFLAKHCREVIGMEVVDAAVADAEKNAQLNGIGNCRFMAGDVAKLVEELETDGEKIDLIVLNPPRKGCDAQVLKRTAALAPAKIIYVSCSPETLARDLNLLHELGYQTEKIQPVDMFPQTPHVENVALLTKQRSS